MTIKKTFVELNIYIPNEVFDVHYKSDMTEINPVQGLQGRTARDYKERYTLCVLAREQHDTIVTKEYFINNAKSLTTIGSLVENKVSGMDNNLQTLYQYKAGEVITSLDDEKYRSM